MSIIRSLRTNNTIPSYEQKKTKHNEINHKIQSLRNQIEEAKLAPDEHRKIDKKVAHLTQKIKITRGDISKAKFTYKLKTAVKVAIYAFVAIAVISAVALAATVPPFGIPILITTLLTASPLLGIPLMIKRAHKTLEQEIGNKEKTLGRLKERLESAQEKQGKCREKEAKITELKQEIAALKKEYNDFLAAERFLNPISKEDLATIKEEMKQATDEEASQRRDAKIITPQRKGYGEYNNPYISTPVRSAPPNISTPVRLAPPTITITDPNGHAVNPPEQYHKYHSHIRLQKAIPHHPELSAALFKR